MERAYSILEIKSVDEDARVITGIATTPTVDRMGDVVDPKGAEFQLPIPLLWQHNSDKPIGHVTSAKVTKAGIEIRAQIAKMDEPGLLKDTLDYAWQSIKARLVRGLSIGFKGVETSVLDDGSGFRFLRWLWLELSAVTIPANAEASIQTIRALDAEDRGRVRPNASEAPKENPPGDTGSRKRSIKLETSKMKKSLAEQISGWEATRKLKADRQQELLDKSAEDGTTLDAEASEEYDGLTEEVKRIDEHIERLKEQEKASLKSAAPVDGTSAAAASASRSGEPVRVEVRSTLPKGTAFTRYVMAMAAARGVPGEALAFAKRWDGQTPEVSAYIKQMAYGMKAEPGMVSAPGGSPQTWGAELAYPTNLASEFVELLYPATLLGKMSGFRTIPFNVRVGVQDGGATVNWVGEAAAKPVTELSFTEALMTHSKIAGIVVLTDELVRLSTPSAEATVRNDLVNAIAKFMDEQMLDASITATSNRPASLTQGVSAVSASGYDADALYIDINAALAGYDTSETGTANVYVIMRPSLARALATIRNPLGQFEFSGVTPNGGTLHGFQVLVSNSAPSQAIVFVKTDEVWLADDGQVTIDASREATLDMSGGDTPTFNLFQKNCVAIRAERWIRWQKRRTTAVQIITGAQYNPAGESPA